MHNAAAPKQTAQIARAIQTTQTVQTIKALQTTKSLQSTIRKNGNPATQLPKNRILTIAALQRIGNTIGKIKFESQ